MMFLQKPFLFSRVFLPRFSALARLRCAICISFFIQGAMFATWSSRIPDIKSALALNDAQLGALLLFLPAGELLSIIPNGLCVKVFGSRPMLLTAGFLYPCLIFLLGLSETFWVTALLLFCTGAIANLSNTAVNTQGILFEQYSRRSMMGVFHGMWSLAGLVAVGFTTVARYCDLSLAQHFTFVPLAAILVLMFSGGALANDNVKSLDAPRMTCKDWKFSPMILCLGLACFGCMACEGAVYNWSSVYLRDTLHTPDQWQSAAYLVYLCTMVCGRFIIDGIVNRLGRFSVLFGGALAISMGFALSIFGAFLPIAALPCVLGGFALIGCGTCAVVPLCCGLAGTCKDIAPGIAIAEISTIGFFGFLVTPPLIGYLSETFSLSIAFGFILLLSFVILGVVLKLRRLT